VFGIQIPAPNTPDDFNDIRWYFYHKPAVVLIDNENDWIVELPIKCEQLDENGKCKIYNKRPSVCQALKLKDCPANIDDIKEKFQNDDDYKKWLEKNHPDVKRMIYRD